MTYIPAPRYAPRVSLRHPLRDAITHYRTAHADALTAMSSAWSERRVTGTDYAAALAADVVTYADDAASVVRARRASRDTLDMLAAGRHHRRALYQSTFGFMPASRASR